MSDSPPKKADGTDSDRIDVDGEPGTDLDEVLREAVDAVATRTPETKEEGVTDEAGAEDTTVGIDTTETLRVELEELRQRSTRTLADFDNYRKRVEREKRSQELYSGMEVLRGLLDIVDNLERALASDGPVDDLKTGVEMTLRQTEGLLRRHGVRRIEADGAPFDPSLHEAVSRLEQEGLTEPQVTAVLQSGYQMHERLLRPVRVAVAVPAAEPAPARAGAGEDERDED